MPAHLDLVQGLYGAIAKGASGDEIARFFHPDAKQIEYPSLMRPNGHRRGLDEMRAGVAVGAQLIADQHYDVHTSVDDRDQLAVQFTWTATVARDLGTLRAGTRLVAHVAAFYLVRDGLILRQSSYDCYEPPAAVTRTTRPRRSGMLGP